MATKFLVSLTLLGLATAGPLSFTWNREVTSSDNRDCALQCSGVQNKFQYLPDTTYIYQYEINTETSVAGASEDSAVLNIQTYAEIEVVSSCEFSLRLKNTQVSHSDPYMRQLKTESESEVQRFIERNRLRFSFDDGVIKTVCPETNEEPWVLNFKRGLLSAFQNSMKNFDRNQKVPEVDVTGQCEEVEYNVSKSWSWAQNTIVVSKSKNLLSCSKRDGFHSFLQMVPYTIPSDMQSLPLFKSTHTCEQNINAEKILQSSSCAETHVYVPFSNYQSGERTVVTQKLTFQSKRQGIDTLQGVIDSRHSLLFQHTKDESETLKGQESAEQKLKEICEQTAVYIRPETPRLFIELVQVVKTLKLSDLRGVYQKLRKKTICPQNEKAMKFFMDALPVAGTPGTVEMMLIIFKQGKVNEFEKQTWLLSLSLINDPSDEMMKLVLKLLKEPMTLQALLPVSALVNNYCQKNANCVDNYYVSLLLDQLDENIDSYCAVDDKTKQLVLRTLRAIGNIGRSRKFVATVDRCIQSSYAPIEVKLSAVEAYRRIPCPDVSKESDTTLVTTLQDKTSEPELRIASYQALMRCPTDDVLQLVVDQLKAEDNDEVGEYIYSHLTNLKKTSDPHKQDIATALRRFNLEKNFEANILRSSRNYESSVLLNKFNLGYVADADLLWAKSSSLPRAFKANLTMELFGNSINLLDFGGRMEGMEYLPSLVIPDNQYQPKKDNKPLSAEDFRLGLYGRMFGNELAYQHFDGENYIPTKANQWKFPDLLMKWSKKFNYDFTHSMQLFHGSVIIPTIAGLPLHITVNSSASAHLHLKGQVQLNKIMTKHRSFSVEVDSLASAGLEVTGTMLVDAYFRKVGLRIRNTLQGNLPFKAQSSLSQAGGFSFELDAPDDRTELFDARTSFFIISDSSEKEQKMITDNRREHKKCTGSRLARITGFELCGEFEYPNASMKSDAPYFPLTGPTSASLVLLKRDTHSGYKLFVKWDKKKHHTLAQFQLNTPGSQVNRLISTDVTLGYQRDKHIDVILTSPWKKLNLNGKLISNKNVKRMVGTVRVDEEDYGLTTEVKIDRKNNEVKYSPLVEIIYKGETKTFLSGQATQSPKKGNSLVMNVNGMDQSIAHIEVGAKSTHDPKRQKTSSSGKLKVKSSLVNADVSSSTVMEKQLINSRLKVAYDIEGLGRENMKWAGKYSDKSKKSFKQYKMSSTLSFKKHSDYNLQSFLDLHQKRDTKMGLKMNYGKNFKNKMLTLGAQFPKSIDNLKKPKVYGMMNLKVPEKEWDMKMEVNHLHETGKIDSSMDFQFLPFINKGTLAAQSKLNPKDFSISANYVDEKKNKIYSLDVLSKMRSWNAGRWSVKTTSPSRNVEARAYFRRDGEKLTGDAALNWDAGKKKKELSEISLLGSYRNSKIRNGNLMKGSLQLKSPFNNFENLNLKMNLDQQPKRLKSNGKIAWGGKHDHVMVDLVSSLPLSLSQVKVLLAVKSPFKSLRQIELDIDHKLNDDLMTVLRGKLNNAETEMKVKGNGEVNDKKRNLKGEISLRTPYKAYKEVKMTLDHSDDFKNYKTIAGLIHNSKTYRAEFDTVHDCTETHTVNTGKLVLTSPQDSVETTWNHHLEKEMKKLESKLISTSKNREIINFEASGSYEDINSAQLQVDLATKWKAFRKGSLQLSHRQNDKVLATKAVIKRNRAKTGYEVRLLKDEDYTDVRLNLFLNPLYKRDVSFRSNVKHVLYPMTASAQLEWAPNTKINFDGSMNAPSVDNFDLSSKLTTPFENYENIHVKSSVKKDSSELIAHLNIDYAIQKMIDLEARYRNDDLMKLLGAKFTSPCEYIKSLDTALQLETTNRVNAFKADFSLQSLDTYASHINLRKQNADLNGKIQVVSPVEGYEFMETNGWLRSKRDSKRTLHLDFKTDPNKDYSLDLTYKRKLPVELTLNIKTPNPEFDNVGLDLSHDWSRKKMFSHGRLTYMPKKTVEVSLDLLLTPKFDGSLNVKTPFETFEHNEIKVFYDGKMHDFNSHGSMLIGETKTSCDVKFKRTNYKTSGDLTFNSPYENLKGNFMLAGKVKNMRGKALLQYGDKVVETEFSNVMRKDSLKTNFKIVDPSKEEYKFSLEHEDKSTKERRRILHKQSWTLAKEETNLETTIDHRNYENTQAVINLTSATLPLFRNVNISLQRKADFIDFSTFIDTQSKILNVIGLIFKSSGQIDNMNSVLNLTLHYHPVIEVTVDTKKVSDTEMDGKIMFGGLLLPKTTSELKLVGDKFQFTSQSKSSEEEEFSHVVKYRQDDKVIEWDSAMTYNYYYGSWSDRVYFKRDLSDEFTLITKWLVSLDQKPFGQEVFGFEVGHKGDYDKFATTCDLHMGMSGIMKGKLDFFKDGLERIEMNAGLTSPFKSLEDQSVKFRFEGQDTRFTSTLDMAYASNTEEIVTTLMMQNSPHKIFTFSVESPKHGDTHLLISSELEDGKVTAKVTSENEVKLSVLGVYSNSFYPYHPHVHVLTPFPWLKDLTINLQGQPLDGSADASLLLNENDKVEGKAVFQYENPFALTSSLSLDSTFENFQDLLLELKNTEDPISKKSVLILSLNRESQIRISGDYQSKEAYSTSKIDKQFLVDVKLPLEDVQSMSLMMALQADVDKVDGQMGFDLNLDKVLDMDVKYNIVDKKSVSLTVRKPKAMEYSLTQTENGGMSENEVYLNWNRDEPESNVLIKSTFKDVSDSSKTDRAGSLSLVHSARSIGVEHSQLFSSEKVVSAGKLFWNTDDNSRVFYNLNLNDKSRRTFTFMDGELVFGGPMRTMGLSGNVRNTGSQRTSDVSFSWDLDNDKNKKVSLVTKVSGDEDLNADILLKLPAEVQVDSKWIWNKGNTIFDGKTDISYSWDDRKTLTLTSKLENNPVSYSLFSSPDGYNYSMQFGIKHPDTKVDMKFKSHVGNSEKFLTSSMGLEYLTSYRQRKNIALWLEIDKLKRQINVIGTDPYKNLGFTGTILSRDPLKVQAVTTTDDGEKLRATLDVDYALNKLQLGVGKSDNTIRLTAFYPNQSTFQVDVQHSLPEETHEEAALTMRLATSRLMITDLKWRPEMIKEAQDYLIQTMNQGNEELKTLLSEISLDVEKEITRKYRELTSALSEDSKPLLDFVKQEMRILLQQINAFERKWNRGITNNDLYLGDLVKTLDKIFESVSLELVNIQKMSKASIKSVIKPLNALSEKLEDLKKYPIRKTYQRVASEVLGEVTGKIDEMVQSLKESILDVNNQISNLEEQSKVFVVKTTEDLANHPWIQALTERLQLFKKCDISPQLQEMLASLQDSIAQLESVKMLKSGATELYQQAKWAYNYWEIEKNVPKLLQSSLVTLQEVTEEEIQESLQHLIPYLQNPVVVFDPETGLMKTVVILPFDLERLDEMPKWMEMTENPSTILRRYVIDLQQYWPESNETTDSKPSEKNSDTQAKPYNPDNSEIMW